MNKNSFFDFLRSVYKDIGEPIMVDKKGSSSWYLIKTFSTGISHNNKSIGIQKDLSYYVVDEGTENENVLYSLNEPDLLTKIESDSSYESVGCLFHFEIFKRRAYASMLKIAKDILFSNCCKSMLSENCYSGSSTVKVSNHNGNFFLLNKTVTICDETNREIFYVEAVSGDTIKLKGSVINDYLVSNGSFLCKNDKKDKLLVANTILSNEFFPMGSLVNSLCVDFINGSINVSISDSDLINLTAHKICDYIFYNGSY